MKFNFHDDKPVETTYDDDLGRTEFSYMLADSLTNWSGSSLVLGVCGEWGSGKTSIINMALEKIRKLDDEDQPIIVTFNPWLFSNRNQIIKTFFDSLILETKDTKFADKLKTYSEKLIPGILTISGILAPGSTKTLLDISKYVEKRTTPEEGLELLKDTINKLILDNGKQIIIIIDDIDRLDDSEIRLIFQLVNKLADFTNTVYLLAFDKDVVTNALTESSLNGSEYLKKIVQITIDVPAISKMELQYFFIQHLKQIVEITKEDENELNKIFESFLSYYFRNIRDIKRYINNIKFLINLVKDDVNWYDFLVLCAIQIFSPDLYRKIYENKKIFIETSDPLNYLPGYRIKQREKFKTILENVKEIPQDALISGLSTLFPKIQHLDEKYDNVYSNTSPPVLKLTKGIEFEEYFETYFKYGVPDWELSKVEFEAVLDSIDDPCEFNNKFMHITDNKKIKFLNILEINIENSGIDVEKYRTPITEEQLNKLFKYYIFTGHNLSNQVLEKMELLVEKYVKKYDPNLQSAKNLILTADNPVASCLLVEGLYEDNNMNKTTLGEIKERCADIIKDYLYKNGFQHLKYPFFILRFWKEGRNEKELLDFMENLDDTNLVIFLSYIGNIPRADALENLKELFDLKKLEDRLKDLLINELNESNTKLIEKILRLITK